MTLIKGGRLISPRNGLDGIYDLQIEDGVIKAIGSNLSAEGCSEVIDASGKLVFPGFIDMHVHLRDPGQTYKEDILSGCEAAAAGGVTSVVCMPNTRPAVDNAEVLSYIREKAEKARARVYPVACINRGMEGEALTDMSSLRSAGGVAVSDEG